MVFDFSITSTKELSELTRAKKITKWLELVKYVKSLPYGRNTNRTDLSLVLKEGKGSCSSKHAFLKALAIENDQVEIDLVLAIYKMNAENTNVGMILEKYKVDYIPEAHCYLKVCGKGLDATSTKSSFEKIEKDILCEMSILPEQVANYKVNYHQDYIKEWIQEKKVDFSFDEVWKIREECIAYLSC
ncbi:hypothetical protein ACOSP6_01890 [Tenacibaculum sp. MEBiC06402]|uniref:hypothetical protein n=1 Tax=unclassified Tenacibaculum TaxID=2635139 RepID=UPI003B9DAB8D